MSYDLVRYQDSRYEQPPQRPRWSVSRMVTWVLAGAVIGLGTLLLTSRPDRASGLAASGLPPALAHGECGSGLASADAYGNVAPSVSVGSPSPSGSSAACHEHGVGPAEGDFVNILLVQPSGQSVAPGSDGSAGSFASACGRNEEGHRNSDNFITAPGVVNGAHHTHDYVGNVTTNGRSTNESLADGATTCRLGDQSTYFWPVLRRVGTIGTDAEADGGGKDGNAGEIMIPDEVSLEFLGNAQSKVVAMPRFLRVLTGDAKAHTNGPANVRARWTCVGFTDRVTQQYPLCPDGGVQRILEFPSCWDGENLDSANHRTHITFPGRDGGCRGGTVAVPRLRMTLTYSVPPGRAFALDSFPEQQHKPITDHGDFVNVMPPSLMALAVECINTGQRC
jgi:Domain of unknown function (DUF1996)